MPNLWRQFKELLPDSPLLLGTVAAHHTDGTITVELLDGGLLRVTAGNGDAGSIGDRVFVRNGQIEGSAPALPTVEIEI
jgi:hypothetical protein